MGRVARIVFLGSFLTTAIVAQQSAPAFEVASVKPNSTDAEPSMNVPARGAIAIINVPLHNVIIYAHGIPRSRVVDAPGWITSERFDITAKPPVDAAPGQTRSMLQTLLAERFKLRVHREMREQPIYALVLARSDGRLGPRLKPTSADCGTGTSVLPPTFASDSPCGELFGVNAAGGAIISKGQPLGRVISALGMAVNGTTIVDRTGLQGRFDVELRWSSDVNAAPANSDTPSVFTALQEQLGLKLEASRGPVEVLVIDSVERPTPD